MRMFPACAGLNREIADVVLMNANVPRVRGVEPSGSCVVGRRGEMPSAARILTAPIERGLEIDNGQ